MKERLKALAKRFWPYALAALVCFGLGFYLGRKGPTPDKVTEKSHVEETSHVVATEDVKAAVKVDETKARRRNIKVTVHTEKKPDGTVTTDKVTTVADSTDTKTDTSSKTDAKASEDESTHRTEEHLKVTEYRRNWKASVLIGGELQNPLRNGGNPFSSPVFGLQMERRLSFIPFIGDRMWFGAWGLGNVGPQPTGRMWMVGLSLGVEF